MKYYWKLLQQLFTPIDLVLGRESDVEQGHEAPLEEAGERIPGANGPLAAVRREWGQYMPAAPTAWVLPTMASLLGGDLAASATAEL